MNTKDEILLKSLGAADVNHRAFTELFKEYRKWLLVVAQTILENEMDAKDLVQDFFIDFWEKELHTKIRTSLRSFLFASVRNRCYNKLKRDQVRKRRLGAIAPTEDVFLVNFLEDKELQHRIIMAVGEVPPKSARVFRLTYMEQKNRSEVAQALGISPSTVKHQLARAVRILRGALSRNV